MKKAFTLPEVLMSMSILGVLAVILITAMRPWEIKEDAIKATGKTVRNQLETSVQDIVAGYSKGYTLAALKNADAGVGGTFSIDKSSDSSDFIDSFMYYLKYHLKEKGARQAKLTKKCNYKLHTS